MPLKNTSSRFGTVARFFHWSVFALFLYQFVGANVMTRLGRNDTVLGMDGDFYYDWHKSVGLLLLALAAARLAWRRSVPLPRWHASLSSTERTISHRLETGLYALMFALPLSGFLYVMAGGYGVRLFGAFALPNPIGEWSVLASVARISHVALTYAAIVVIAWHVGLGIKKHVFDRSGLMNRMLPFRD